jgi:cysteine desulfurase family protein (TIGR01976 family)
MTDTPSAPAASIPSVEQIRDAFPALARRRGDVPIAYFDAPGGTQVPRSVADAVRTQLLEHNANAHWAYDTSRELDRVLEASRAAMADFVGGRPDEVVFGANMTTLTFHAARALGRRWGPGDEIVVTELDHQANVSPWRDLEVERSVAVRVVPLDPDTGDLDWRAFEEALSPRTRLVAVTAASNALGTLVDLARAGELARASKALLFADAVHFAPHERMDVGRIGCDFLVCSPYKFYGPHVGVLWGKPGLLEEVAPPKLAPAPDAPPECWETGTLNHEGIAGAGAAVEFLASLAGSADSGPRSERLDATFEELSRRGDRLVRRLWEGLDSVDGVGLYGPPPDRPRTPTVSFTIDGWLPEAAADRLSEDHGLFLSHGNFYASLVTARLGVEPDGLLRAGCACYTTMEEVDRLVEAVERLALETRSR